MSMASNQAENTKKTWEELISEKSSNKLLFSRTCCILNHKRTKDSTRHSSEMCICGRSVRFHSFTGESLEERESAKGPDVFKMPEMFRDMKDSCQTPVNIYGTLKMTGCKFIRVDQRNSAKRIFDLLCEDFGKRPVLILSVYGGAKYFTMAERLEKEFMRGIIEAASTAGKSNKI